MKVVVFEAEPREASAFDSLKPANEVQLVAEPLRAANAASPYSEFQRKEHVTWQLSKGRSASH